MWWLFMILIGAVTGYFYLRCTLKKKENIKNKDRDIIKKAKEEIKISTIEEIEKTIPVFIYKSNSSTREVEEDEEMDLSKPFFVLEGEFSIYYSKREICTKKEGQMVCYTLCVMGQEVERISCRSRKRGKIRMVEEINKYVLFSMLKKKCIEVASRYFKIERIFVEKEGKATKEIKGTGEIKILQKGEILKKRGESFDQLVYIHYGEIEVNSSSDNSNVCGNNGNVCSYNDKEDNNDIDNNGNNDIDNNGNNDIDNNGNNDIDNNGNNDIDNNNYTTSSIKKFGEGSVFGYFSLFFDVYRTVEIVANTKTKISIFQYSALKMNGFDEEDLEIGLLPDFIHLVDICCEWQVVIPRTTIFEEGEIPRDFYYINEGRLESTTTDVYYSGMTVGSQECILGIPTKKVYSTKVSDIIRIPRGLVEEFLQDSPSLQTISKILGPQSPAPPGNIITILPTDKDERSMLLFTRRLKASMGPKCLLLSSKDLTEILSKKVFSVSEELRVVDYLRKMAKSYPAVLVYTENEYCRFLRYLLKYSDKCLITGENIIPERKSLDNDNVVCDIEYVKIYQNAKNNNNNNTINIHHVVSPSRTILFCSKDFQRLGRFLLNK
ncbi:Lysophospholipase NTE1, partial [Nosema granulosis]